MSTIGYHPNAPMEWTTFGGRPPGSEARARGSRTRRTPTAATPQAGSHYWAERRRAELTAERRANPDVHLRGLVVPYGVPLPSGQGDRLIFTPDTRWRADDPWVSLQTEHGGDYLGVGRIVELDDGVWIDGNIIRQRTAAVGDRRELSVGLADVLTVRRRGGLLEVTDATLTEVSLVHRGRWGWHTRATLEPVA